MEGGFWALGNGTVRDCFGNLLKLCQHQRDLILEVALIDLLDAQVILLAFIKCSELAALGGFGEPNAQPHIGRLPIGQLFQSNGNVIESLLALVFQNELFELGNDGFLPGVSIRLAAAGRLRILRGPGRLQKLNHLLHVLLGELAQHSANSPEHLDILARDPVAFEFSDNRGELVSNPLCG